MKAFILIVAIFISVKLYLKLLPWCGMHLPLEASVVVSGIAAFAIIFGLCSPLAKQLGLR